MLKARVLTALVVIALLLSALLLLSPVNFCLLVAVIVCYGAWEWSDLAGLRGGVLRGLYVLLVAILLWGVAQLLGFRGPVIDHQVARSLMFSALLWWLIALALIGSYPRTESFWYPTLVRALMGLCVLVPAWAAVVVLLNGSAGRQLLITVVALVVVADTGAYFSGRRFGRHKLAASVSPGKTLEGVAGGLVASLLLAGLLAGLLANWFGQLHWVWVLGLAAATALASVVGDLLESMVKRSRGVKDSGAILPGHGGVLDRIDSLTAALPVFTFVLLLTGEVSSLWGAL